MKFSTKAEYGLRAMANLAGAFPSVKNIKEVSRQEGISLKYLEKLIGILRNSGLVKSYKGKAGGYVLSRNPQKITAGDIIESLDGPATLMKCGQCGKENSCSSSFVWFKLEKEIKKTLNNIKLSKLI